MTLRRPFRIASPLLALVIGASACAGTSEPSLDPEPWSRPVPGAVAVTAWTDDGEPTTPFGPGGYPWQSPAEILQALEASLGASDEVTTDAAIASTNGDGTVIGWVRLSVDDDGTVLAEDLRVSMRRDGGSWHVAGVESRSHCSAPPMDGRCP
jgi:hypothetical protein